MEQRPNKTRYQRAIASLPASNGQTYSYKATYNPATGVVTLWRDGVQWVSWTDSTPLTSGQYIALRTSQSSVSFDNVRVSAQSGVVTYPHADHLGSVSLMTNQVGSALVNTTARYFPFGDWRTKPTADLTEWGFTGHRHNNLGSGANDLGLIYMNARFYVPGLGRFASADSIVPDPANPQSFNRYSYVLNSPLNFTDPSGHRTCSAQEAEMDFETCDQNLGAGDNYGYGDLFNNAFPYFYLDYLLRAARGEIDAGQLIGETLDEAIFRLATQSTAKYVANFSDDNALVGGMNAIFGEHYIDPMPSDFLNQDVSFIIAAAYFSDADRMNQLGQLLAGQTPTGMPCSFSADTLVMTDDGLIPISQVTLETIVLAFNEETGEIDYYPVIAVWVHEDPVIVYLTIDGETVITTPEHPFYTSEDEWVEAASLQPGDKIRNAAWGTGTVKAITFTTTPQTMYNFTVATAHTYFVGYAQWLVHNDGCLPSWVKDGGTLVNYGKNLQSEYKATGSIPSTNQLDIYIKRATEYGVQVRLDPPHPGTPWNVPHLNVGSSGQVHIPVPQGYTLP